MDRRDRRALDAAVGAAAAAGLQLEPQDGDGSRSPGPCQPGRGGVKKPGGRRRLWWAWLALVLLGGSALALNPLATFNLLMPKDRASVRLAEGLAYGRHDRQRLDIYAPRRRDALLPVVIFFYGGGWENGTRSGYGFAARAIAAQGFLVVVPDYRLVPEVRFPDFLRDCAEAVRWSRRHVARYGGDADRIVLLGHSAGAYNAAMLAFDPRWLGAERTKIRGVVTLSGPFDFLPLEDRAAIEAFGR